MTATGLLAGCHTHPQPHVVLRSKKEEAVAYVKQMGGLVFYENKDDESSDLEQVHLSSTPVIDIAPLAVLTTLRILTLDDTQVRDVSPLAQLTRLTALNLRNTKVSDVSPLATLMNLEALDLRGSPVSKQSIQQLQQTLPKLYINLP